MKMRKQRFIGLTILAFTALILVITQGGRTPEDSNVTVAFLTGPLGLYMLLSKTYILYDGEGLDEVMEGRCIGEEAP